MKRFTVLETLRRRLKRFGHARLIASLSMIVIVLSVGIVANAVSDNPITVSAPTVHADIASMDVEETTTSEETTVETTDATTSETTTVVTTETTTEEVTTTTSATSEETTTESSVTETTTTEVVTTTESTTTTVVTTEVHIVYKPKTHYFHMSNCRWYDKTCVDTWDINTIEGRICSECHPDIELVNVYTPPQTTAPSASNNSGSLPITQAEFYMLANLVAHEYGADWVPVGEKAKVVATVMNRVRMSRFPNSVREVILQRNQYCWVPDSYYWRRTTQGCKDAVTYYFNHKSEFSTSITSFWGDGRRNHFY